MQSEYPTNWYIDKSKIHGVGVHSKYNLRTGARIDKGIEKVVFGLVPKVTFMGSKVNHSWNPNAILVYDPTDGNHYVHAAKPISAFSEITLDYRRTPPYILGPNTKWK